MLTRVHCDVVPAAAQSVRVQSEQLTRSSVRQALPQERQNMILIPCWGRQHTDSLLEQLVNAILRTLDGTHTQTDLRKYTSAISAALAPVQQGGVHTSRN